MSWTPNITSAPESAVEAAAEAGRECGSVSLRLVGRLGVTIGLLLLPFFDHHSRDPVWLHYSWDYWVFLAALMTGGAAAAFLLAWTVRSAPSHQQRRFAYLLLAVPVGVALGLELYLGYSQRDMFDAWRQWGHTQSFFMGFEAAPNHRWKMGDVVYTTGPDSFRTHKAPRVVADAETLIVVMGGSSTFGFGLNDEETWAHRLEERLRARFGDDITVLNAGNSGHNTLQQLIRYYLRVRPLRPDYVIYYGTINDVRVAEQMNNPIWMPEGVLEAASAREYVREKNRGQGFYFENSLLLNRLKALAETAVVRLRGNAADPCPNGGFHGWTSPRDSGESQGDVQPYHPADPATAEAADPETLGRTYGPALDNYLRNLEALRLLCQEDGTGFLVATEIADRAALPPVWGLGFDYLTRGLREHCRQKRIPVVDLLGALADVEQRTELFFDKCHPSRRGAEFVAAHLADALTPLLAAGGPKSSGHGPETILAEGFGTVPPSAPRLAADFAATAPAGRWP